MFRRLFLFRRLLATTFLAVFVNVFLGQCVCAGMKPAAAPALAGAPQQAAPQPAKPSCHGRAAAQTNQKKPEHQHESGGGHDCCKDKSASLLSSLTKPAEKPQLVPAPAVLPAAAAFYFRPRAGQWNPTAAVALLPPQRLKPKIPDIRIFIQSLTV